MSQIVLVAAKNKNIFINFKRIIKYKKKKGSKISKRNCYLPLQQNLPKEKHVP